MSNAKLGLDDLVSRGKTGREATTLMNVKVPNTLMERVGALAAKLRATKTAVVIAILNEGLDAAETELEGWEAPPPTAVPEERRCTVLGCDREKVAKGICATHYQAQRRALGELGSKATTAVAALKAALEDTSDDVRKAAAEAIQTIEQVIRKDD